MLDPRLLPGVGELRGVGEGELFESVVVDVGVVTEDPGVVYTPVSPSGKSTPIIL